MCCAAGLAPALSLCWASAVTLLGLQVNFARQQQQQRSRGRSPERDTAGAATTANERRSRSRSPIGQVTTPENGSSPLQRSVRSRIGSNTDKPTLVLAVSDRSHAPAAV